MIGYLVLLSALNFKSGLFTTITGRIQRHNMWYVVKASKINYYIILLDKYGSHYLGYENPLGAFRAFNLSLQREKNIDCFKYALLVQELIVARIEHKNGRYRLIESIPYSDFLNDN